MTAELTQAIPGPNHPFVDRYRNVTSVWYPWLVKILDFVNGIARGELLVDGAITSRTLATGAITADAIAANAITAAAIAANAITVDKIDAANIDVLDGTFGALQTNTTTTRVQITNATNELRCYVGGTLIASIGANVITNGAFIACTSPSAVWYPAQFTNTSAAGGALICATTGGYTVQADQTTANAGQHYAGSYRNSSGGHAVLGASSGNGSYAGLAITGTWSPFTGSHPGLLSKSETPEVGDIIVDGAVVAKAIDDVICYATRSSAPNQPAVGAYTHRYAMDGDTLTPALGLRGTGSGGVLTDEQWDVLKAAHDFCVINSIGEGCINVCGEGGDITAGDLIVTSSMRGKGMRQLDDYLRSYTVARAREGHVFASPTDTAQIACIYVSG